MSMPMQPLFETIVRTPSSLHTHLCTAIVPVRSKVALSESYKGTDNLDTVRAGSTNREAQSKTKFRGPNYVSTNQFSNFCYFYCISALPSVPRYANQLFTKAQITLIKKRFGGPIHLEA
ncbi:hypothetical protein HanRHA438_Chr04g0195401 [Helianthus annuus]|nr:hypothetical protein HanRHA438_Chr04g0195401 [Helianthus annuus]